MLPLHYTPIGMEGIEPPSAHWNILNHLLLWKSYEILNYQDTLFATLLGLVDLNRLNITAKSNIIIHA